MNGAITELQVVRETYSANEPIYRSEGNVEQADFCAKRVAEIDRGIRVLESFDELEEKVVKIAEDVVAHWTERLP